MRTTTILILALSSTFALAACSGGEPPAPAAASSSALAPAAEGTYDFVLEASDVAVTLRARCESENAGDTAKADACWKSVLEESTTEKIRFSKNAAGQTVWTSFAVDGTGKEEVFVEVPLTFTEIEPGMLSARAAGWPRGTFVGQLWHVRGETRFQTIDENTVAILDPKKGRLVYRRR